MLKKVSIITLILIGLICLTTSKFDFLKNIKSGQPANHWAVLIAGSNGFWNYRHQSDILHAYHILISNGLPKENIIVFAYDDIANDSENPYPGKVFNKPDPAGQGFDVYAGVQIDYKGEDVNPANFLNVLEGKAEFLQGKGTGRVLNSNENDNVFVYFSDHGATGLIAFPSSELYADQLNTTLKNMSTNKRFKQIVFYLEACESGSMFDNVLPNNINIYTTTAANPNQSSWATYCSPDDNIGGKSIGSCLGDEYSVNWMEDSDASKELKESLQIQYENVKTKTTNSEVHQYGDLSYTQEQIGNFQGKYTEKGIFKRIKQITKKLFKKLFGKKNKKNSEEYKKYLDMARKSVVNSREAKLRYLYQKAETKNDRPSQDAYVAELRHMSTADNIFKSFDQYFEIQNKQNIQINFDCLRYGVEAYKSNCQWGEYDLKYVRNIAIACEKNISLEEFFSVFKNICKS